MKPTWKKTEPRDEKTNWIDFQWFGFNLWPSQIPWSTLLNSYFGKRRYNRGLGHLQPRRSWPNTSLPQRFFLSLQLPSEVHKLFSDPIVNSPAFLKAPARFTAITPKKNKCISFLGRVGENLTVNKRVTFHDSLSNLCSWKMKLNQTLTVQSLWIMTNLSRDLAQNWSSRGFVKNRAFALWWWGTNWMRVPRFRTGRDSDSKACTQS